MHPIHCHDAVNVTLVLFTTYNGVRQGGILSPKWISLYIDDLSLLLREINVGCHIDSICVNHLFYADDLCLMAPSAVGLQLLISVCEKYGVDHDILYNPIKSKCMTILPSGYRLKIPSVKLNSIDLVYTNCIKYLGVLLSSKLDDNADIARQIRCLYTSSNILFSKFAYCTQSVKLHLLESFCLSFYCASLWCTFTKHNMSKIRVAYNNVFRKLLRYRKYESASYMFVHHRIDNFESRLRTTCFKFRQRLLASNNDILICINNHSWNRHNYMWRYWDNILYKHAMFT